MNNMVKIVDLSRQFVRWSAEAISNLEVEHLRDIPSFSLTWQDLLERRRVVILAEAGSGKSTELARQAEILQQKGKPCFKVTLQNIGRKGSFGKALSREARTEFDAWKAGDYAAWLLLDSIDEAKKADFAFADLLSDVAEAIDGAAGRIHIILTGRYSDWEFKRDLDSLLRLVAIPPPDLPLAPLTPNEALVAALHDQTEQVAAPPEEPVICVMAPLDRSRVEQYARAQGVADVGKMLAELEQQNLWSFSRRPIDLDWLVNHWRTRNAFGSLAEMIERSLVERLRETNSSRARKDSLGAEQAMTALQRIGAALVLTQRDTITIPDATRNLGEGAPTLSLSDVLPDWSSADQAEFLTRPVFDPEAAGFVRLHNDNQGSVRGYLAARWLLRLRTKGNCPLSRLFDLLFANIHGVRLVKPSMRDTAAWLSLWEHSVAQQVIMRDPRLLMDAGDPGSLVLETRIKVLDAMIELLRDDPDFDIPDRDALRRFAKPDLAPHIGEYWKQYQASPSVCTLLCLLIWLGKITGCAPIALDAATGRFSDRYTRIFAGRAVATVGNTYEKRIFLDYLLANASTVPAPLIWDALETMFPSDLALTEMLTLVDHVRSMPNQRSPDFRYYGPKIAERLPDIVSTTSFIDAIVSRLTIDCDETREIAPDNKVMLETLEVAAIRLLKLSSPDDTPTRAVDIALLLARSEDVRSKRYGNQEKSLIEYLQISPSRRRASLWHAVATKRARDNSSSVEPWDLELIDLAQGIGSIDLPWLLDDVRTKTDADNICFATKMALSVWQRDRDVTILDEIRTAAGHSEAAAVVAEWLAPRVASDTSQEWERKQRLRQKAEEAAQAKTDASWIDFADRLRADPDQLRSLSPPTAAGIDSRLYHLWKLLNRLGENRSRHAISDLSPIRQMFSDAVADALRDAFIGYWRLLDPRLPSERPIEKRNVIYNTDMIGIVGITQEALANPDWAAKLGPDDVQRATRFAVLELNGFPFWLSNLACLHPRGVGEVLWKYIEGDLFSENEDKHPHALSRVASGDACVIATVADRMLSHLETQADAPLGVVDYGVRIVRRGSADRRRIIAMALDRFSSEHGHAKRAAYLAAAFAEAPERGVEALATAIENMARDDQINLVQSTLVAIFGESSSGHTVQIPFVTLERLVRLAFFGIHPDDDNKRLSGIVYSPDERDDAEFARGTIFRKFTETPGFATYAALARLREDPTFPVPRRRITQLMRSRAEADGEAAAWRSGDLRAFETDFDSVPATSADLQRVALARLEEIEHELLHGDFNQGLTVAGLNKEVDVQNWFANELRRLQGRSYSLEREPHVAGEKEPDIRLQSRIADARMPIEIKVAESWSLRKLKAALSEQLRDRYLRDRDNRFGILLIVHQKPRLRGWETEDGHFLDYAAVIVHLSEIAKKMAAADTNAPQMEVYSIDVSARSPLSASDNLATG